MKNIIKKKKIKFLLQNRQRKVKVKIKEIEKNLEKLSGTLPPPPFEISVIFVSDRRIKELNKKFLGKNFPTDILSFKNSKNSGELIISVETAKRNAPRYSHSLEEEIVYLIIHGSLHLKGYRDYTEKEREEMEKIQEKIFARLYQSGKD
ncbi:rRNA maturation RNase YbeY [bacterium]|nr:rRNA maturation RNase YbeY [bacterium]